MKNQRTFFKIHGYKISLEVNYLFLSQYETSLLRPAWRCCIEYQPTYQHQQLSIPEQMSRLAIPGGYRVSIVKYGGRVIFAGELCQPKLCYD